MSADYTFGFADRKVSYDGTSVTTLQKNAGDVEFDYNGSWRFVSCLDDFDLQLGRIFRVGGDTAGNVVRLYTADGGRRTYSAQMEVTPVPEPTTLSLLGLGLLGMLAGRKKRCRAK